MKAFSDNLTKCILAAGALLLGLMGPLLPAADDKIDFTGHYELAGKDLDRSFSWDINQTDSQAKIAFSASMLDGSGAAPDGEGSGSVDKSGQLKFTFKDSFDNEGTGVLVSKKDGYHLTMTVTKVGDSRPLRFYGDVLLRKTSDKVRPDSV